MKCPDALYEAIQGAAEESLQPTQGISAAQREQLVEQRVDAIVAICEEWFRYGEYLTVEVDTEVKTCTVKPV